MSKYGYLRQALESRGLLQPGRYLSPAPASERIISLAHAPDYVARAFSLKLDDAEIRRIGLPGNDAVLRRSRLSAAGTILAGWLAIEYGIACNSAGGSHHAAASYGAGFCVFNDVAVAIRQLMAQGVSGPFMVIDADVHQGDGTARIFAGDASVFTLSVHSANNFPARKAVSDLDVALPDGTSDHDYVRQLDTAVEEAFSRVTPRLVFYNAGVDVHADDKLGRLSLTDAGIRARDRSVIEAVRSRSIPLVGVLGGGYSDDPVALSDRHAILFEEAARVA